MQRRRVKVPDVVDPFTEEKKSQLREFVLQASNCLDKAPLARCATSQRF